MNNKNLNILKEKRGEVPQELKERVKEARKIKRLIRNALKTREMSVPELSKELSVPTEKVFWYITSMRKYGEIKESSTHNEDLYYTYSLILKE